MKNLSFNDRVKVETLMHRARLLMLANPTPSRVARHFKLVQKLDLIEYQDILATKRRAA